jgi:hypothetical protein
VYGIQTIENMSQRNKEKNIILNIGIRGSIQDERKRRE